jgi:DNA-binding transcriptional LysR family regulator
MNGLDALATAAKEGAGIVRVPWWQAEADLAAGRRCGCSPTTSRRQCHCTFVDDLVERWRGVDPFGAQPYVDR